MCVLLAQIKRKQTRDLVYFKDVFIIDYSDQMSGVCVLQRQARLLGVMQRAHDSSLLKEEYYKKWVRLRLLFSVCNLCVDFPFIWIVVHQIT